MSELPFDPSKLPHSDFKAPDLIGAVEGWRSWSVAKELPAFEVPPKMYSVTHGGYFWVPRQRAQAECSRTPDHVPGEECSCGFYSAKSREHLMSMGYHTYNASGSYGNFHVLGQVANWGKVVEGTQGWRSQFSYPVALFVPYEAYRLAKPLSKAYGVPVMLDNFLKPAASAAM